MSNEHDVIEAACNLSDEWLNSASGTTSYHSQKKLADAVCKYMKGMEMKATDEFTIICRPDTVSAICPHCDTEVESDIKHFDWDDLRENRETMRCSHCDKEFRLEGITYD